MLAALGARAAGACLGFLPLQPRRSRPASSSATAARCRSASSVAATIMAAAARRRRRLAGARGRRAAGRPAGCSTRASSMVSRRRAGVSLLQGGRDHLTHRLRSRLRSARAVALALGAVQAALCAGALWLSQNSEASTTVAWGLLLFAGAATVTIMETQAWVPVRPPPSRAPMARARPGTHPAPRPGRRRRTRASGRPCCATYPLEVALVLHRGCELRRSARSSTASTTSAHGARSPWACSPLLLGLVIARPAVPRPAALAALAALAGLAIWALVVEGLGRLARERPHRGEPLDALRDAVRDPAAPPARRQAREGPARRDHGARAGARHVRPGEHAERQRRPLPGRNA